MSMRRTIWTVFIFLSVLTIFRLLWVNLYSIPEHPKAVQGLLDLRSWEGLKEDALHLNGEWEFYPEQFIMSDQDGFSSYNSKMEYVPVPASWETSIDHAYGYGSYRLRILIDPVPGQTFGIRVPYVSSSSELYVNGELLVKSGQPASSKFEYEPSNRPYTAFFTVQNESEIELVIHAANFDHPDAGGVIHSIKFGMEYPLRLHVQQSIAIIVISCVVYMIHALYSLVLFFVGKQDKRFIYFSMMIVFVILATLNLIGERLFFEWFPFHFEWEVKVQCIGMIAGGFFLLQCLRRPSMTGPEDVASFRFRRISWTQWYSLASVSLVVVILLLPASYNIKLMFVYAAFMFIPCAQALKMMTKLVIKGINQDNLFLLLAAASAIYSLVWLMIISLLQIEAPPYPIDLMAATICFAIYWFRHYFRTLEISQNMNMKLQKMNKEREQFLQTVAHEMKNPLHGILNIAQAVHNRETNRLHPKSMQELQLIQTVGRRMTFLLNDLLELGSVKAGKVAIQPSAVSIYHVTDVVVNMLRFMTEGKSIQLTNQIPENFPFVHADENRLNQILFNLLHNAIKYTHAGEVAVRASIKEEWAVISVEDTGQGIDEKQFHRVFEPYAQISGESEDGFGLGLSICKQLVELHGGEMNVHSKKGKGSVFSFTLKLSSEQPESAVHENCALKRSESGSVLEEMRPREKETFDADYDDQRIQMMVVDDDPVNLKVIESIFEMDRYAIYVTTSGEQALSMLRSKDWDLIITDVSMPRMSGFELTARIRESYSILEIPILMLTAYGRPRDVETGLKAGANDYVTKPVNPLELKARVESLTKLKRSTSERLRMEAAWLQAQIRPHFIINTFNSIAALGRLDLNRMDELIQQLSNFIRLSIRFQNTEELFPLEYELELIRSYVFIQKERFGDRIAIEWDVQDSESICIPPLTIQPLVENAITHGILQKMGGGVVRISIQHREKYVEVSVTDNGAGMDEAKAKSILEMKSGNYLGAQSAARSNDDAKGHRGIGLLNVDRRLKHLYGQGLKITSELGKGTVVSFQFPKNKG